MTKAQSDSGKTHIIKTRRAGSSILLCTGRAISFMLPAADSAEVTCKACAKKVAEMGGIPE
jgi:hydroxymethylpyrimidine pyrophosphatase-like HAD family hydrolase